MKSGFKVNPTWQRNYLYISKCEKEKVETICEREFDPLPFAAHSETLHQAFSERSK